MPFCSERCKLQDLARWIDGRYRVPAEPVQEDAETDARPEAHGVTSEPREDEKDR